MQRSLERLRQRRVRAESGFTLIELLIVIVILGILAAIVVFAVQNLTGQSATAACQAEYKTVETALEAYKAQEGAYPTALTALTGTATTSIGGGSAGPWLKDSAPTNSTDNSNFWFSYIGTSTDTNFGQISVAAANHTTAVAGVSNCSNA